MVAKFFTCLLIVTVVTRVSSFKIKQELEEIEELLERAIDEKEEIDVDESLEEEPEEEPDQLWKKQVYVVGELFQEEPDDGIIGHEDIFQMNQEKRYEQDPGYPTLTGISTDAFAQVHPNTKTPKLRPGQASLNFNCKSISSVPADVQAMYGSTEYGGPGGVPSSFYKKYLNAYGIPIVGSGSVKKKAMKRACYTLVAMLAGRYDIRNAIYKNWGRYAILAYSEPQTTLPDYLTYAMTTFVRGLGPKTTTPVSSSGEENLLCQSNDYYPGQDITIHEFAHMVDRLGAMHIVPGFAKRLDDIFTNNTISGKWANTYAARNEHEFFGIVTQFYWNAWRDPYSEYVKLGVVDQATMRVYDPAITELLDEIFPCADTVNNFVQRCPDCVKGAVQVHDVSENLHSNCPVTKTRTDAKTAEHCLRWACMYKKTAAQYFNGTCQVLSCPLNADGTANLQLASPDPSEKKHIYSLANMVYTSTLGAAQSHADNTLKQHCVNGPDGTDICNGAAAANSILGPDGIGAEDCRKIGGCYEGSKCYNAPQICNTGYWYCYHEALYAGCSISDSTISNCKIQCGTCGT